MANFRIFQGWRARHPEFAYPNEPKWNGALISLGAGFFVAFAGFIVLWIVFTSR